MAQIFLSYSSEDRERVLPLVEALEADGYTVWWDREIRPGPSFDREIEKAIDESACIVVVWSDHSIESEWVRSEVEEGVRRSILVPIVLDEGVMPPLAYRRRQSADLSDWTGQRDGEYEKLLTGIEATIAADESPVVEQGAGPGVQSKRARPRRRRVMLPTAVGLAFVALVIGAIGAWLMVGGTAEPGLERDDRVLRFELDLPPNVTVSGNVNHPLFITPDGRKVVFNGQEGALVRRIYVRSMDDLEPRPVSGVEYRGADLLGSLWNSPDGEWIIFNDGTDRAYKKVRILGGAPVRITETNLPGGGIRGLSMSSSGDMVYANSAQPGLMMLKDGAGAPSEITQPRDGYLHEQPELLPDGNAVLFNEAALDLSEFTIMLLDLETGETRALLDGRSPKLTSSGHLLFSRDDVVWATAFDLDHLETYGKQAPVLENTMGTSGSAMGGVDVAGDGTLAYLPADDEGISSAALVWVNFDGTSDPLAVTLPGMSLPKLSPDGRTIVVMDGSPGRGTDLWTHSIDRATTTRLTFGEGVFDVGPAWTPDGEEIVFTTGRQAPFDLMVRKADGTGAARKLTEGALAQNPAVTVDGKAVVFVSCDELCNLARVSIDGDAPWEVLLQTGFSAGHPAVSPNMKWIAYDSYESGRAEVYVRPYPDLDSGRWQVSTSSGLFPLWSGDGSRLFYMEAESGDLKVVRVTDGAAFVSSNPETVVNLSGYLWRSNQGNSNVSLDLENQRVLTIRRPVSGSRINVTLNWFEELERLVPTAR